MRHHHVDPLPFFFHLTSPHMTSLHLTPLEHNYITSFKHNYVKLRQIKAHGISDRTTALHHTTPQPPQPHINLISTSYYSLILARRVSKPKSKSKSKSKSTPPLTGSRRREGRDETGCLTLRDVYTTKVGIGGAMRRALWWWRRRRRDVDVGVKVGELGSWRSEMGR